MIGVQHRWCVRRVATSAALCRHRIVRASRPRWSSTARLCRKPVPLSRNDPRPGSGGRRGGIRWAAAPRQQRHRPLVADEQVVDRRSPSGGWTAGAGNPVLSDPARRQMGDRRAVASNWSFHDVDAAVGEPALIAQPEHPQFQVLRLVAASDEVQPTARWAQLLADCSLPANESLST